jgi:hypothetical protein
MVLLGGDCLIRWCESCRIKTDTIFCPKCRNLTTIKRPEREEASLSNRGDIFECKIWQGPNFGRGIRIGMPNRDKFFSKETSMVVLHIEGVRCIAELTKGFWGKCPEIRIAKDDAGENFLEQWILKNDLLPPGLSGGKKGKYDIVLIEVVEPDNEFKLYLTKVEEKK